MSTPIDKIPSKGFFRTQIEAFAVAIAVALAIKTFAVEAYQVPTESMEPTIIGRNPGGDFILVSRSATLTGAPERFEVLVFRYPLSQALNYVKRLVGMPGERVELHHGDVYAAKTHDGEAVIVRKPDGVQAALFDAHDVIPKEKTKDFTPIAFRSVWETPKEATLRFEDPTGGGSVSVEAMGEARFAFSVPLDPVRRDAAAEGRKGEGDQLLADLPISDLRVRAKVDVRAGFALELTDGTAKPSPTYRATWLRSGEDITVTLSQLGPGNPVELGRAKKSAAEDRSLALEFENVDDRLRVRFEGEVVLQHEYVQPRDPEFVAATTKSKLSFSVMGGIAVIESLEVHRDLYYTRFDPARPPVYSVPDNHYFFLGDNSANSLDARGWRATAIRRHEDGMILVGDREAVSDDFRAPRHDGNPYFDADETPSGTKTLHKDRHLFLDIQGNVWRLKPGSYDLLHLPALVGDGTPEVLALHRQIRKELPEAAIAKAGVTNEDLGVLTTARIIDQGPNQRISEPPPQVAHCTLMHYVQRENIAGQAWFIFARGSILQAVFAWDWRTVR